MTAAMRDAMRAAGFVGIEAAGHVIYARTHPALPEFTATHDGAGAQWRLAIAWPLRASAAQCAGWTAQHPDAPLDVDLGETRMQFCLTADLDAGGMAAGLAHWAALVDQMVGTCALWRRASRQMDEGM